MSPDAMHLTEVLTTGQMEVGTGLGCGGHAGTFSARDQVLAEAGEGLGTGLLPTNSSQWG